MNSFTIGDQLPIIPFGTFAVKQSRIPCEGNRNGTSVRQRDGKVVFAYHDTLSPNVANING